MTDFHHNVFYFYRGAKDAESDRERQLENNTTKALINTLDHGGREVQERFVKWLGIDPHGQVHMRLQKKSIGDEIIRRKRQRLVVGIAPIPEIPSSPAACSHDDSLPDAWIYGDDFVVMIESKIVGCLNKDQMERHRRKLNIDPQQPLRCLSWAQVHRFFNGLLPALAEDKKWIVEQFTQYLEYIKMAEFVGFRDEMFDFFFTNDDEDVRAWVRNTLHGFGKKLLPELQQIDPFYEDFDVGKLPLKKDHGWVAFGPASCKYRHYAHQTVIINAQGIDVIVNVELKSASDRLKERIQHDGDALRKLLLGLEKDPTLCIQIEERIQRQASIHDNHPVANIQLQYLRNQTVGHDGFEYLQRIIQKLPLPSMVIRRRLARKQVLALSQKDQGQCLVQEVIKIMKDFHKIIRYINGPE